MKFVAVSLARKNIGNMLVVYRCDQMYWIVVQEMVADPVNGAAMVNVAGTLVPVLPARSVAIAYRVYVQLLRVRVYPVAHAGYEVPLTYSAYQEIAILSDQVREKLMILPPVYLNQEVG